MVRIRTATERVMLLAPEAITKALEASDDAKTMRAFYQTVGMSKPSRSYYVRFNRKLHSLKAVATFALREHTKETSSTDFHAADAAKRLRDLEFDVIHESEPSDRVRERRWAEVLDRPEQAKFRERLFEIYSCCPLSGCATPFSLEAAHIVSVKENGLDIANNGILLRADLHKLFDANLIAIDPVNGKVDMKSECRTDYGDLLTNAKFSPPVGGPALRAFAPRWKEFHRDRKQ